MNYCVRFVCETYHYLGITFLVSISWKLVGQKFVIFDVTFPFLLVAMQRLTSYSIKIGKLIVQ